MLSLTQFSIHDYFLKNKKTINSEKGIGFRKLHIFLITLIMVVYEIIYTVVNDDCGIGILRYFSKAFNTFGHGILLDKVCCYGFIVILWFELNLPCRIERWVVIRKS